MASLRQAERFFGRENVIIPQLRLIPAGLRESRIPNTEGETGDLQRIVRESRGPDRAAVNRYAGLLFDDAELNAGWAPAGSANGDKADFAVTAAGTARGRGSECG